MSESTIRALPDSARRQPDPSATDAALQLLEEVISQASMLRRLADEAYGGEDRDVTDALVQAMGNQIARIGWISELAYAKLGGQPYIGGTAGDWMLSRQLAAIADPSHGDVIRAGKGAQR